jgi:hypothetical protein
LTIINLISGPRNISTALMYSFAQRDDTTVLDEPFYAVYLSRSGAMHPAREEVLKAQSTDEDTVKKEINSRSGKKLLFIKNMAHHMEVLKTPFIENAINVFLIRDPQQIIASYSNVIEKPTLRDIGLQYQCHLFDVLKSTGQDLIVLDSGLLLKNPSVVLEKLCHRCAISFQSAMLSWERGAKPYDGVWSNHWYKNVHNSTGFNVGITSNKKISDNLHALHQQARGYYQKLLPFSLKA